ncbi:MAG: T9SS type A sorting domain-containing protein [Aureispira sp.]
MKTILLYTFLLVPFLLLAQDGPAGVGNSVNNGLWLRAGDLSLSAGDPVANWPDISGNGNNGQQTDPTKRATFVPASAMNNQAAVRLDGVDDLVEILDDDKLDGSTGLTYFAVIRPNNLDSREAYGILGKRITFTNPSHYAYTWFFWTGNRMYMDLNTQDNRLNTNAAFNNATNYIVAMEFDGTLPRNERSKLYNAGEVIRVSAENSTTIVNSSEDLVLGALNKNYRTYFGADYAEVIQFNRALNDAERIIVHNYLSAKYNIPLNNDVIYDEDNPANGNFDFEVAGIGRVDANNIQDDAKGTSALRIAAPSNLGDNEFLLWGHNNGAFAMSNTSGLPSSIQASMGRVWRASEVNNAGTAVDVGTVTMRWDLNGLSGIDAANLRLLVDTDNDGQFDDEAPIAGALDLGTGVFEFTGIGAIVNNARFTLAIASQLLPIELVDFSARLETNNTVTLQWITSVELNNDFFTVERSTDGVEWTTLTIIQGAGNSREAIAYYSKDERPLQGTSYYRLKQTDFDGQYSYSPVRAVNKAKQIQPLMVYPNPTQNKVVLQGPVLEAEQVRIFDVRGTEVTGQVRYQNSTTNALTLDLSKLAAGVYIIQTPNQVRQVQKL